MGTEILFSEIKRPKRQADKSPLSSIEIKNAWSYVSTPPHAARVKWVSLVTTVWCIFQLWMEKRAFELLRAAGNTSSSSSSSLARQPYVGPGLPQTLLPAEVSGYCFFRFRDKSLFQGGGVSPTPNPRLSWSADVFCQGCLP
jgi:hypothetical protein